MLGCNGIETQGSDDEEPMADATSFSETMHRRMLRPCVRSAGGSTNASACGTWPSITLAVGAMLVGIPLEPVPREAGAHGAPAPDHNAVQCCAQLRFGRGLDTIADIHRPQGAPLQLPSSSEASSAFARDPAPRSPCTYPVDVSAWMQCNVPSGTPLPVQLLQRVSRQHCEVSCCWQRPPEVTTSAGTPSTVAWQLVACVVVDVGSRQGTWCNGIRLMPHHPYRVHGLPSAAVDASPACCGVSLGGDAVTVWMQRAMERTAAHTAPPMVASSEAHVAVGQPPLYIGGKVEKDTQTDVVWCGAAPPMAARSTAANDDGTGDDGAGVAKQTRKQAVAPPRGRGKRQSTTATTASAQTRKKNVVIVDDSPPDATNQGSRPVSTPAETRKRIRSNSAGGDDPTPSVAHCNRRREASGGIQPSAACSASLRQQPPTLSLPQPPTTIVTTGTRLSASERLRCEALRLTVNPPLSEYQTARYLVIEPPLSRSVKLLTAIPYVEAFLQKSWLDAVLASGRVDVPTQRHLYSEPYTRRGIEAINGFRLDELMSQSTPSMRQSLLLGFHVLVHAKAQPQEAPLNDLRHVVVASGGVLCDGDDASDEAVLRSVNLVVLPTVPLGLKEQRALTHLRLAPGCVFVSVEDLFRAVLQQKRPEATTVAWLSVVPTKVEPSVVRTVKKSPARQQHRTT